MTIGLVSQALPYRGNLIRHLSRRHEIHLVSLLIEDNAKYSWESRARVYEALYEQVIKERKSRQFAERS